eukprot:GHVU01193826.1.p2 GENE.GHVU01193826.1~~GHVU01193826.1.p2  ORF type:complete len:111 (-),score=15.15 GHVU01193826.1:560-892(-)
MRRRRRRRHRQRERVSNVALAPPPPLHPSIHLASSHPIGIRFVVHPRIQSSNPDYTIPTTAAAAAFPSSSAAPLCPPDYLLLADTQTTDTRHTYDTPNRAYLSIIMYVCE